MQRQEIKTQHSIETIIIGIAHAFEVGDENGEGADIMSADLQAFEIAAQGFYFMIAAAIERYPAGDNDLFENLVGQAAVDDIGFGSTVDDELQFFSFQIKVYDDLTRLYIDRYGIVGGGVGQLVAVVNGSLFFSDQVEIDDSGVVIHDHLEMFEEPHAEQAKYFHALIVLDMSQVDEVCIQVGVADGSQAKAVDSGPGCHGDSTGQASAFDWIGSRIIAEIGDIEHQAGGSGIEDKEAGSGICFRLDKDQVAYAGKGNDASGGIA